MRLNWANRQRGLAKALLLAADEPPVSELYRTSHIADHEI
jgi:hypothetical protein